MITLLKNIFILVLFLFLIRGSFVSVSHAQNQKVIINAVSDTMPNTIQILLDDFSICNLRNKQRNSKNQLTCDKDNFQLDPDTYTMDEYVSGVLKAEVGPVTDVPVWHIEALKAMAVAARSFGWTRTAFISGTTYQVSSVAQKFFLKSRLGEYIQMR